MFLTPVRPGASVLRRRRLTVPRFAPIPCPSACRLCFPGLPRLHFNGWVDDESRCSRTLHPQLAPRMNLRVQSSSQPCLTCDAVSISSGFPLSASRPRTPVIHRFYIAWPDPAAVRLTVRACCFGYSAGSATGLLDQCRQPTDVVPSGRSRGGWCQSQNHTLGPEWRALRFFSAAGDVAWPRG
jgi:hypothetical protein